MDLPIVSTLLWIRGRDEGSEIQAMGLLPGLAARFPQASIVAVVPAGTADLYAACPHMGRIIGFDPDRALRDRSYLNALAQHVGQVNADLALNSGDWQDEVGRSLVAASKARQRVGYAPRGSEHPYTVPVEPEEPLPFNQGGHPGLARALGLGTAPVNPSLWLLQEDLDFAGALFREQQLDPGAMLACFPGGKTPLKAVPDFPEISARLGLPEPFRIIAMGATGDFPTAEDLLATLPGDHLNLCGDLLLRREAAVLQRCRGAMGPEGRWADMAWALGVPHLILRADGTVARGILKQSAPTAAPSSPSIGPLRVRTLDTIAEIRRHFGFGAEGIILEDDVDVVETACDLNQRRRRDAEVLTTFAANLEGPCLDLGTSHGNSAYKFATNLGSRGVVHTVNILPEQADGTEGELVTHWLTKEEIGLFYRQKGIQGIRQHYANTARWQVPDEISGLAMAFVDAAHDTKMVLNDSRLAWQRLRPGGYMLWHDFSPAVRHQFEWIDACMRGVELFLQEAGIQSEIVQLRHSWIGILRKPLEPKDRAVSETVPRPAGAPVLDMKRLRYILAYPAYSKARISEEEALASRIRSLGYDLEAFPLYCAPDWLPFPQLDQEWKQRSSVLMSSYEALEAKLGDRGVLIAAGGSMLHPEFVAGLKAGTVFICADDPESSEILSRPAAPAFDLALPANVACVDDYRTWGCRNVSWLALPFNPEFLAPGVTEEQILTGHRELDIVMFCERVSGLSDRAVRIETLVRTFPQAFVRGRGWPGGFLTRPQMLDAYRNARIGWNLHNSIGPVNTRTTTLPALGVLEICDNASHLGKLFELDREVVGFETIPECIDKTRYYLDHDQERREIAARGWKRAMRDYTEEGWWRRILALTEPVLHCKWS